MYPELTTLLPQSRERTLRREYFLRLATLAVLGATALVFVATALLTPSYVYLLAQEKNKTDRLALVESTLVLADEAALSARLAALSTDATRLIALGETRAVIEQVRTVLDVPHDGVSIVNIVYAPSTQSKPGTIAISGTATTRNALRAYQIALAAAPFSSGADLPVSAYAKDADIPFTITVTFTP